MSIFDKRKNLFKEENKAEKEKIKKIRNENLGAKDILALILALLQLMLPFLIIGALSYFLVLLFLTKFWLS